MIGMRTTRPRKFLDFIGSKVRVMEKAKPYFTRSMAGYL